MAVARLLLASSIFWLFVLPEAHALTDSCRFKLEPDNASRKGTWQCAAPVDHKICFYRIERLSAHPNRKTYNDKKAGNLVVVTYDVPFVGSFVGPWRDGTLSWLEIVVTYSAARNDQSC